MPHKAVPLTPRQKAAAKAAKTRKILKGANTRASDDEDEEDLPWEWIYEEESRKEEEPQGSEDESADEDGDVIKTPRKRAARNVKPYAGGRIVGARKGTFDVKVGDAVLLRSEGGQTWAGLVWRFCEMEDDDGFMEKAADFLCERPPPHPLLQQVSN
jgi:hypothetical protein